MNELENPLKKHFRTISLYMEMPSRCERYDDTIITKTDNNEYPVYPMTLKDEILLQTPDALMNGEATKQVITSCIPSIKDPGSLLTNDLDAVLIAIRIASYGHDMNLESVCPKCTDISQLTMDLRQVLGTIKHIDDDEILAGDLTIKIKPHTCDTLNTLNLQRFEEQRIINALQAAEADGKDIKEMGEMFKNSLEKITKLSFFSLIEQIDYIEVDDNRVTNKTHIEEFLDNCDKNTYTSIFDGVEDYNVKNSLDNIRIVCSSCSHEFEMPLEFNSTNFFV